MQEYRPVSGSSATIVGQCMLPVKTRNTKSIHKKSPPESRGRFLVRLKGLEPARIAAREPKGDVTSVKYLGANVKGKINRSAALDNYPGVMLSKRR